MASASKTSDNQQALNLAEIFEHFTNYGQEGYEFQYFPVRCFVRYRFGKEDDWQTFWERKRDDNEIELERNYEWKDDKQLNQPLHAEKYAIRRLEKKLFLFNKTIDGDDLYRRPFQVDEYYYSCSTRTLNFHFSSLEMKTRHRQPGWYFETKCYYPGNIMLARWK